MYVTIQKSTQQVQMRHTESLTYPISNVGTSQCMHLLYSMLPNGKFLGIGGHLK